MTARTPGPHAGPRQTTGDQQAVTRAYAPSKQITDSAFVAHGETIRWWLWLANELWRLLQKGDEDGTWIRQERGKIWITRCKRTPDMQAWDGKAAAK